MLAPSPAEGEGSSGRAPTPSNQRGRTPDAGPAVLHPLLGERQIPAYPPEIGEGSSAHPTSGHPKPSLQGPPFFTLSKGRGECWRLRQQKVRGLPVVRPPPATSAAELPTPGPPFFTLSWGRGRFRRTRRKSVRGLPRTQPRVTQSPPSRGRPSSPSPRGEENAGVFASRR